MSPGSCTKNEILPQTKRWLETKITAKRRSFYIWKVYTCKCMWRVYICCTYSFHLTFCSYHNFLVHNGHSSTAGVDKKRPSGIPCHQRPKSGEWWVGGFSWCLIPAAVGKVMVSPWGFVFTTSLNLWIYMISTYVQLCLSLLIFFQVQNNIFQRFWRWFINPCVTSVSTLTTDWFIDFGDGLKSPTLIWSCQLKTPRHFEHAAIRSK